MNYGRKIVYFTYMLQWQFDNIFSQQSNISASISAINHCCTHCDCCSQWALN